MRYKLRKPSRNRPILGLVPFLFPQLSTLDVFQRFLDSPTMVKALRQASKNIMFTIVRSGNYTMEAENTGMDNMTRTFLMADIAIAVVLIAVEALVVVNFLRKRKSEK